MLYRYGIIWGIQCWNGCHDTSCYGGCTHDDRHYERRQHMVAYRRMIDAMATLVEGSRGFMRGSTSNDLVSVCVSSFRFTVTKCQPKPRPCLLSTTSTFTTPMPNHGELKCSTSRMALHWSSFRRSDTRSRNDQRIRYCRRAPTNENGSRVRLCTFSLGTIVHWHLSF